MEQVIAWYIELSIILGVITGCLILIVVYIAFAITGTIICLTNSRTRLAVSFILFYGIVSIYSLWELYHLLLNNWLEYRFGFAVLGLPVTTVLAATITAKTLSFFSKKS